MHTHKTLCKKDCLKKFDATIFSLQLVKQFLNYSVTNKQKNDNQNSLLYKYKYQIFPTIILEL